MTRIIVRFNGQDQDDLTGSDLRKVAGSHYIAPTVKGSYLLSVEAQDGAGCSAGADRPMTVNVK